MKCMLSVCMMCRLDTVTAESRFRMSGFLDGRRPQTSADVCGHPQPYLSLALPLASLHELPLSTV